MNASDRRRLVFATVFTVVALPALWVSGRDQARVTTSPSAGAVGVATPSGAGGAGGWTTTVTTTYQPSAPVFLGNDVGGAANPPLIPVEHGTDVAGNHVEVRATYRRYKSSTSCTTPYAAGGATIKVTNIDNGQSITCRNVLGPVVPPGDGIIVHTELLADIADLADAPISVRLSW